MGQESLNKPTVIALCTEYSIKSFGGTEVLVASLVRGLAPKYQIILVSNDETETISGSEFAPLIRAHIPWRPDEQSAATSRNLAQQLSGHRVDLAHFHFGGNYGWGTRIIGRSPIEFATRHGIRCVTTVHSFDSILSSYCGPAKPLWFKLALLLPAWIAKMHLLCRIGGEVAVSRENLRRLSRWYWPFANRFHLIYHSRIHDHGSSLAMPLKREPIILSVGQVAFRKGQHVLTEAFAKIAHSHPEWRLVIVGGIAEIECRTLIEAIRDKHDLGERICFAGSREGSDYMRRAAIFVQPSLFEGLGLALQEALFHGCACIGSRVGGIPELIEDGSNGLLFSSEKVDELADALSLLLNDENRRHALSIRAPASIIEKQMTAGRMIENYVALYESVLNAT